MKCIDPKHQKRHRFCIPCSQKGCQVQKVLYCQVCHKKVAKTHDGHSKLVIDLKSNKFLTPLNNTKDLLKLQTKHTIENLQKNGIKKSIQDFKNFNDNQQNVYKLLDQNFNQIIQDQKLIAWLLKIKFWTNDGNQEVDQIKTIIANNIQMQLKKMDENAASKLKQSQTQPTFSNSSLSIDFDETFDTSAMISDSLKAIQQHSVKIQQENQLCEFFIRFIANLSPTNLDLYDECNKLIKKYPQVIVLYLAKIHLVEIIVPKRTTTIPQILQSILKIDPDFQKNDLYYYFSGMAYWKSIDYDLIKSQNKYGRVFCELKDKKYYELVNSKAYLKAINKAILIKHRPVYYVAKGIGQLVERNFQAALESFQQAISLESDAVDLNTFWAQFYNKEEIDLGALTENLNLRTMQFIIGLSKHFKKEKNYGKLIECCKALVQKETNNQLMKIQLIKALIYHNNQTTYSQYLKQTYQTFRLIQQLGDKKKVQKDMLQKRLRRMEGRKEYANSHFEQSCKIFNDVKNRFTNYSASDLYNYAASKFRECVDDDDHSTQQYALDAINSALQKDKTNKKYIKLKFFILCYLEEYEEASKLLDSFELFRNNDYEELIQHVRSNA